MYRHTMIFLFATALLAQSINQAETAFKAAYEKEMVDGDLKTALTQYEKLARGANRAVAAKALVRIGQCHEKLGTNEARKAYERVLRDFADQSETAATARARLASMGGASSGSRTRLLWDNALDTWGKASADGRYFSFTDWSSCDLGLRDLVTGETRKLTRYGDCIKAQGEVWGSAVSHDGKRVAYGYFRYGKPSHTEMRLVNTDGTGDKPLIADSTLLYADPGSWSPDGKWIAAEALFDSENGPRAILLISATSAAVRRIPVDSVSNPMFSPDGKWLAYSSKSAQGEPSELFVRPLDGDAPATALQDNARIMGWMPDGKGLLFSRTRGERNDLFVLPFSQGNAAGAPIPIYTPSDVRSPRGMTRQGSLLFTSNNQRADSVVLPWSENAVPTGTPLLATPAALGVPFGSAARFSHDGKRLLTVRGDSIVVRDLASKQERTVTPQLRDWNRGWIAPHWTHDDSALLMRGADTNGKSGLFRVDLATGIASLIAGLPDTRGAFALSREGKTLFHGNRFETIARDLATGQDKKIFETTGGGSHEVVLSPDGARLAIRAWTYLAIHDLRTGQIREIYRAPKDTHTALWSMDWTADGRGIVAIVRPGTTADKMEMWTFSPEGGEPVRRAVPKGYRGISLSSDGKHFATTILTSRQQVWALENFLPPQPK